MTRMSPNTQAILLLTSCLSLRANQLATPPLTPAQYRKLAARLHAEGFEPADLLAECREDILSACEDVGDSDQIRSLLDRGLQLAQAIEVWSSRAIWVISRADANYPAMLRKRLGHEAPALLFGCGPLELAETGGLAIVGSRAVDDEMTEFTRNTADDAARAGVTVVSGGAKGVDVISMETALANGSNVVGVLADSMFRKVVDRTARDAIVDGRLLLLSPFDPETRFLVWNAMDRNKVIYALAQAGLVVNADYGKGGTWSGATELLRKHRSVPLFVRTDGTKSLKALCDDGAQVWPNIFDRGLASWLASLEVGPSTNTAPTEIQGGLFDQLEDEV